MTPIIHPHLEDRRGEITPVGSWARSGRVLCCVLALCAAALGGCATRGVTTRALESRPIVQCYERNCSAAEDSRAAAQGGCPSCVY